MKENGRKVRPNCRSIDIVTATSWQRTMIRSKSNIFAFYKLIEVFRIKECPLGVITEETMRDAYHRLFPNGNVGMYVKYVFRTLDTHGNGKITFTQLLVFLSTISKGTHLDRLKWVFRLYDLDGDGAIQPTELLNFSYAIHELAGVTEKRSYQPESKKSAKEEVYSETEKERKLRQIKTCVDKVFRRWDLNQDGQVTWEEFLASYANDDLLETSFHYFDDL